MLAIQMTTEYPVRVDKDLLYRLTHQKEDFSVRITYNGARGTGRRRLRWYDRDLVDTTSKR
jgi:hypothetical protein